MKTFSYREALRNTGRNRLAKFPDRESDRLEPVAQPSFAAGLTLAAGDKVLTMGSCFARNIEEYLAGVGYDVPVLGYDGPAAESEQGGRVQGILNKYTVASIWQEVAWVDKVRRGGGTVTMAALEGMAEEVGEDRFIDLQLASKIPVVRDRLIARRQRIYDIHAEMFACDLVILTPGLTEAWFDARSGLYVQQMPSRALASAEPDRFELHILDFPACFAMLEKTVETLFAGGARQIAFSVSPVPLARTMTADDVLIANTYSKSTIRAAVGAVAAMDERVGYIPSYERVMLTKSPAVWQDDLCHVTDDFVGGVVEAFAAAFSGEDDGAMEDMTAFTAAWTAGDRDEAAAHLERLGERALAMNSYAFMRDACDCLLHLGRDDDAMRVALNMRAKIPKRQAGHRRVIAILAARGDGAGAQAAAAQARAECNPGRRAALERFLAETLAPDAAGARGAGIWAIAAGFLTSRGGAGERKP